MSKRTRQNHPNPEKTRLMMRVVDPEPGRALRTSDGVVYVRETVDGSLRRVGTAVREKDRKAVEEMRRLTAKTTSAPDDSGAGGDGSAEQATA